jgi:hypothetical protein
MSFNAKSSIYTLDELQAYAKKNFSTAFRVVSNPDIYTLEECRVQELDDEKNDAYVLHVGHYNKAKGDVGLWACNVRTPVAEDADEDSDEDVEKEVTGKTGKQHPGAINSSAPALRDTEIEDAPSQKANDNSNIRTEVSMSCYQGTKGSCLAEIDMNNSHVLSQIRYMTPYREIAHVNKNNASRVRTRGRQRLRVFVEYVFMLKGESDILEMNEGENALELFEEACTYIPFQKNGSLQERRLAKIMATGIFGVY